MIYSVTKKYCSLKTCRIRISIFLLFNGFVLSLSASPKHAADTNYPSYHGLVMAGYQGWFHKPEKGMMYPDEKNVRIDMWPDVSEYPETYPTGLKHADGSTARFFCSSDESTVDLHFRWMKEYGIDGVFMQRFFNAARKDNTKGNAVISHALSLIHI